MAREYKDSGIEWIGRIPKDWKVCKLSYIYRFQTGATPPTNVESYFDGDIKWANISDLGARTIFDTNKKLSSSGVDKCSMNISPKGSLMYSFKLSVGIVSFCGDDMYTNEAIATFLEGHGYLPYLYYMAPIAIIHNANFNIYGAPILNQELIRGAKVIVPPLSEQKRIASYLGTKCAEIDSLVELQEQMIAQLTDYKQSVITEAVTKGLNPEAELVSSGIDWIGDYPKHWEIIKIGFIFDNLDYLREPISAELRERNNPQYDYYGASGVIDKIDHYNVDDKVLLIGEDGANLVMRNLPLIYKAEGKFWVNNHAHILKPKKDDYDYLAHALEAANYRNYITGSAQPKLSQENLQAVKLPIPPLAEQQAIASYLDTKCREIDTLISIKRQKIEMLKEYKKSIIFEAVTGKTDLESLALIGRNHWH